MTYDETNQVGMMRIAAWFFLTVLLAVVTFVAPVDTAQLSLEDSVEVSHSADASPFGPDFVPATAGKAAIDDREKIGLTIADHQRPQLVHFRRLLLRYAPKQSPPHTT